MLSSILLAMVMPQDVEGVTEFFPINTGDRWVYTEERDGVEIRVVDTVGEPVDILGYKCYPVITSRGKLELDRVYYNVSEGIVKIIAFQEDKPLDAPYTILQSPDINSKWSFKGSTIMQGELADLQMEGRVSRKGQREFNGKKVDVLEVRLEATILEAFGTPTRVTQVAIYGRGVGLLRMDMTSKLPKRTEKTVRKLVSYTPKTGE